MPRTATIGTWKISVMYVSYTMVNIYTMDIPTYIYITYINGERISPLSWTLVWGLYNPTIQLAARSRLRHSGTDRKDTLRTKRSYFGAVRSQ